jgi:transcriptional regulator with XRE-family HTH domain
MAKVTGDEPAGRGKRTTLAKVAPPAPLYLKQWLVALRRRQAGITADLGWEPSRISRIIRGKQPYTGSDLAVLAQWLGIEPHELLMDPKEALRLKSLREAAYAIVSAEAAENN